MDDEIKMYLNNPNGVSLKHSGDNYFPFSLTMAGVANSEDGDEVGAVRLEVVMTPREFQQFIRAGLALLPADAGGDDDAQ